METTSTMTALTAALAAIFVIWMAARNRGGIKALFEHSRNSPQHWGLFAVIMILIIAFVYLLIRL